MSFLLYRVNDPVAIDPQSLALRAPHLQAVGCTQMHPLFLPLLELGNGGSAANAAKSARC